MHLSYRIASAGRGTGRYDAVDFREIVCRQHNVRGEKPEDAMGHVGRPFYLGSVVS